jgi:hypothetical protein
MNSAPFTDGLFANLPDPDPSGPIPQGQPPDDRETSPMGDRQRTEPPAPTGGSPTPEASPGPPPEPTAGGSDKPPPPAPAITPSVPESAKTASTPRTPEFIVIRPPSRRKGPQTSKDAAASVEPFAGKLCRDQLNFIASQGEHGATDKESQAALGLSSDTQVPRRWELCRHGLVVDSTRRRKTPSGRNAIVWVLREHAASPDGGAA